MPCEQWRPQLTFVVAASSEPDVALPDAVAAGSLTVPEAVTAVAAALPEAEEIC